MTSSSEITSKSKVGPRESDSGWFDFPAGDEFSSSGGNSWSGGSDRYSLFLELSINGGSDSVGSKSSS